MHALLGAKTRVDHFASELKRAKVALASASVDFINAQKQHMAEHNLTSLPSSLEIAVNSTEAEDPAIDDGPSTVEYKYDRIVWKPIVTSKGTVNRELLHESITAYFTIRGLAEEEVAIEAADLTSYIWRSRPERTKTDCITFKLPSKKRQRFSVV